MTDEELRNLLAELARKNANEVEKTQKAIRDLKVQMGGLGNKFGSFTEGLALPSMSEILVEKFHVDRISPRIISRKGGDSMEIDVLGYSNGRRNEVYLVEVKSHLDDDALEQIEEQLAKFTKFFPEHRSKELFGILAGVHVSEKTAKKALKKGIYVAHVSDDVFRLQVPAGFRPHSFKK